MQDRLTSHAVAFGMAVAMTLAMLAGVNELASPRDQQTEIAQDDGTPVQQVIITGHRARS